MLALSMVRASRLGNPKISEDPAGTTDVVSAGSFLY